MEAKERAVSNQAAFCVACCCPEKIGTGVFQPVLGFHTSTAKDPMELPWAWYEKRTSGLANPTKEMGRVCTKATCPAVPEDDSVYK
jgi:hypothetical protein